MNSIFDDFNDISIDSNEVHVWWMLAPAVTPKDLTCHLDILDAEEKAAFSRYKIDSKKVEFLMGRLLTKALLGAYIGTSPSSIHFRKNSYGKPFLANTDTMLHFNLSHSDGLIVCAISTNKEIGVDVEMANKERYGVMRLVFQHEEIEWINSQLNAMARLHAFYTLWTRKEAVMKAVGTGFALAPLSFTVPVDELFAHNDDFDFYSFEPLPGFITSVATRRRSNFSVCYQIHELKFAQLRKYFND